MIRHAILTLVIAVCSTMVARAHTVWIEPHNGQLVVRFAEPGNDLETSPGHLDSLSAPVAFVVITNTAAAVEAPKGSDHFLLTRASPASAAFVETIFSVRGGRKPYFYARWEPAGSGESKPLLTLDLVPTGKAGEVRAYFRGTPLGGVRAALRTPDGKDQELSADADGFIRFVSNQSGQHLLTIAHHREPLAGFHIGRPYQQTSHNTALTWREP